MTNRQIELRAHDLVNAVLAIKTAMFHAEHATQHARDAKESDSVGAELLADIAALEASMRDEIVTAAESIEFTPSQASAEAIAVAKFLGQWPA